MPKHLAFIVSLFLFSTALAQNENYIEVTVNDTVLVQPDQFIYRLNFMPDNVSTPVDTAAAKKPDYYIKRIEDIREKQKKVRDDWQNKLEKAGFNIMGRPLNEAVMKNVYENNLYLQVLIGSIDSLINFYSFIKNEKLITGNIMVLRVKNDEFYNNNLYKKLLVKSRKRADVIATSINRKIISVISITENRNFTQNLNAYYPNTFLPPSSFIIDNSPVITSNMIMGNLTVRFLVK